MLIRGGPDLNARSVRARFSSLRILFGALGLLILYACTRADSRGLYDKDGVSTGSSNANNGGNIPPGANGASCEADSDCNSSFCADGVCCDQRCDAICTACVNAKTGAADGRCEAVVADTDPDSECTEEGAESCGVAGTGCNGSADSPGCNLYAEGTPCSEPNCASGQLSAVKNCDGLGTCVEADPQTCRPYVCDPAGTACLTSCTGDTDCSRGHGCDDSGVCQPTGELGSTCDANEQCSSQQCSDGVCCDAACGGACDTCVADQGATEDGTCTLAALGDPGVPACADGYCDGNQAACVTTCASGSITRPAVDIVLVMDNGDSMHGRFAPFMDSLNGALGAVLDADSVDYHFLVFSEYGLPFPSEGACVEAPLGATEDCSADIPFTPEESDTFFHFDTVPLSQNTLCQFLDYWDSPDESGLHNSGFGDVLRPEAFKVFLFVTDDSVNCSSPNWDDNNSSQGGTFVASGFDQALRNLSQDQFGTSTDRNYVVHTISGLEEKNNDSTDAFLPNEPIQTNLCESEGAVDPPEAGTGYQALSRLTGGLRFPICDTTAYGSILNQIAGDIITRTAMPCAFALPAPPQGRTRDNTTVVLEFQSNPNQNASQLDRVSGIGACEADAYYLESGTVRLCADTCTAVGEAPEGSFEARYACSN